VLRLQLLWICKTLLLNAGTAFLYHLTNLQHYGKLIVNLLFHVLRQPSCFQKYYSAFYLLLYHIKTLRTLPGVLCDTENGYLFWQTRHIPHLNFSTSQQENLRYTDTSLNDMSREVPAMEAHHEEVSCFEKETSEQLART